jgi:O-antigen/teichoic acid export membrane protein
LAGARQGPRLITNAGLLLLSQGVTVGAAVLVLAVTARYLGVARFGLQSVLRATAAFAFPVVAGGLRVHMIREIGRDPEGAPEYVGTVLTLRWALVVAASLLAAGVIWFVPLAEEVKLGSYAAILLAASGVWDTIPRAIFIAYERNEYNLLMSMANGALTVMFTHLAVRLDTGVAGILTASAAANVVTAQAGLFSAYHTMVRPKLRVDLPRWRQILRESLPVGVSGVLKRLYAQVDVWLLAGLKSAAAAGLFSVAYRVTVQGTTTSILLGNAILPRLSRLARDSREQLREAVEGLLLVTLAASVPLAGVLAAVSQPLVLLVVGPQFADSVEALRLVSVVLVTALPNALLFFVLVSLGEQFVATLCLAVTVVANVALDAALIPFLGVRGACLGTIAAEWTFLALALALVHRAIHLSSVWRFVGKPLLAGAVMAVVIWRAGPAHPTLAAVVGLICYGMLCLLLRCVPGGTLRELRRALTVARVEPQMAYASADGLSQD